MENMTAAEILLGVVNVLMAVCGFFALNLLNNMTRRMDQMEATQKSLAEADAGILAALNAFRQMVAGEYVRDDKFARISKELFDKIDDKFESMRRELSEIAKEMRDRVDTKADRAFCNSFEGQLLDRMEKLEARMDGKVDRASCEACGPRKG